MLTFCSAGLTPALVTGHDSTIGHWSEWGPGRGETLLILVWVGPAAACYANTKGLGSTSCLVHNQNVFLVAFGQQKVFLAVIQLNSFPPVTAGHLQLTRTFTQFGGMRLYTET